MFSPNQLLEHDSPADRIRAGRYRDVLDLIEAMADGVARNLTGYTPVRHEKPR